jgi:uncharacterized glyoxalase superfamily protein PhnB
MQETRVASRTAAVPMISYEDAGAAIEWLAQAFGFREIAAQRYVGPDGRVGHAEMETDRGGVIMLASPTPDYVSPKRHRESCEEAARWSSVPWVIDGVQVEVDDVDAHRARAEAAGARMLGAIEDQPYGRLYRAEDLEGHRWMFIQPPG